MRLAAELCKIVLLTICCNLLMACGGPDDVLAENIADLVQGTGDTIQNVADNIENTVCGKDSSDARITAKVKAKLAAETSLPANIGVKTEKSVVYLNGQVQTRTQYEKAISLAKGVDGVSAVDTEYLDIIEPPLN